MWVSRILLGISYCTETSLIKSSDNNDKNAIDTNINLSSWYVSNALFTSILVAEDCDSTLKIRIRHDETDN